MKLFLNLLGLCTGNFIFAWLTDGSYVDAGTYSYWLTFGGLYIYFSFGCHKKRPTKKSPRIHCK